MNFELNLLAAQYRGKFDMILAAEAAMMAAATATATSYANMLNIFNINPVQISHRDPFYSSIKRATNKYNNSMNGRME